MQFGASTAAPRAKRFSAKVSDEGLSGTRLTRTGTREAREGFQLVVGGPVAKTTDRGSFEAWKLHHGSRSRTAAVVIVS